MTYIYTGFCGKGDKSRTGAMATVLGADMLTIREAPVFVAPGCEYGAGTGFEGHEFFEAPPYSVSALRLKKCEAF